MANSLINETSPYLLQHAHNPVDWHPWNESTLQKARSEKKMLLISIGYAACHWCHVMAHESFENENVARIMNDHFICIKVDREERPDVDQVYMNAAYLINGNGGWPLNALALPDGRPFFAGTYFPVENWIRLLEYFAGLYVDQRPKLEQQAENLAKGIREIEHVPLNPGEMPLSGDDLREMVDHLEKRIDWNKGGLAGGIKFPMPSVWELLLQYHHHSGDGRALEAVVLTLDNMARAGIYDQVGGGFSRYATDPAWHVPHFEKMLYDNAQLVSLYANAFQVTNNPLYRRVVYGTLKFVQRELASPEGGYYSSLDADSEGEEGKYYVWTKSELEDILKGDATLFLKKYGITAEGNWEHGRNIPDARLGQSAGEDDVDDNQLEGLKNRVFNEREKRTRPGTDDKILLSWNAMMAKGFIDAYRAFGETSFYEAARKNVDFLVRKLSDGKGLFRSYKNSKASIHAFLDDYAFLISSLIAVYQAGFEEAYLLKAKALTAYVDEHFFDQSSGMYLYTDDQYNELIARKMEVTDNVIPSSNSEMAKILFALAVYFEDDGFERRAIQLLSNVGADVMKNPAYYSNWAQSALRRVYPAVEVAIVGKDWREKLAHLQKNYLPEVLYSGGMGKNSLPLLRHKEVKKKTVIYICKNKSCGMPQENVATALFELSGPQSSSQSAS